MLFPHPITFWPLVTLMRHDVQQGDIPHVAEMPLLPLWYCQAQWLCDQGSRFTLGRFHSAPLSHHLVVQPRTSWAPTPLDEGGGHPLCLPLASPLDPLLHKQLYEVPRPPYIHLSATPQNINIFSKTHSIRLMRWFKSSLSCLSRRGLQAHQATEFPPHLTSRIKNCSLRTLIQIQMWQWPRYWMQSLNLMRLCSMKMWLWTATLKVVREMQKKEPANSALAGRSWLLRCKWKQMMMSLTIIWISLAQLWSVNLPKNLHRQVSLSFLTQGPSLSWMELTMTQRVIQAKPMQTMILRK